MKNILVTGAAGFIGANFAELMVKKYEGKYNIIVYDKLTYAGNLHNLDSIKDKITFVQGDICDFDFVMETYKKYDIDAIVHFAAESHVDNSIKTPFIFTQTNVIGTHTLLEAAKQFWGEGSSNKFVHVSTDEVFGTLGETGYFTEISPIQPNSPYSASKASSDLIALAYSETYKMNVSVTNCSNNYGPYQHHEKLIPHMVSKALNNESLPVYGTGENVRDWIHVHDHNVGVDMIVRHGKEGEIYNLGGHSERTNIEMVKTILKRLGKSESLITFVQDRAGHDRRYAIDSTKAERELGWNRSYTFDEGIEETINWYVDNQE